MSNPLDDYLTGRGDMEKQAASVPVPWGEAFKTGLKTMAGGGPVAKAVGGGAMFAGGMGIASAVGRTIAAITKKHDFNGMLEANPDLKDARNSNPIQFNRHYSSFRNLNPRFAGDPVVAGTYMRTMSEYPESAGKTIVESLKDAPREQAAVEIPMGDKGGPKLKFTRG